MPILVEIDTNLPLSNKQSVLVLLVLEAAILTAPELINLFVEELDGLKLIKFLVESEPGA